MTLSSGIEPGTTEVRGERSHRYATHASYFYCFMQKKYLRTFVQLHEDLAKLRHMVSWYTAYYLVPGIVEIMH
jgi:hypothetical protein